MLQTLVLSRSDVRAAVDVPALATELREALTRNCDEDSQSQRIRAPGERASHRNGVLMPFPPTFTQILAQADLLLVATWASTPVLRFEQVRPGTHITSLVADEPGKAELDPALLRSALVVTDNRRLAASVLPRMTRRWGAVLRHEHPGRCHADEITVFSPLGLPLQDCVAAWHVYRGATELGLGQRYDLQA